MHGIEVRVQRLVLLLQSPEVPVPNPVEGRCVIQWRPTQSPRIGP
jgi:hypothetical protein